jgi:uncharacterized protein
MTQKHLLQVIPILCGLGLLLDLACRLGAELLWFAEVGYVPSLLLKLGTRSGLFLGVAGLSALYLWGNLRWANRLKYPVSPEPANLNHPKPRGVRLRWLLPWVVGLSLITGVLVLSYGQLAVQYWQTGPTLPTSFGYQFHPHSLWPWWKQLQAPKLMLLGLLGLTLGQLVYPRLLMMIALGLSGVWGWLMSKQWLVVLAAWHPTTFKQTEPLFGQDISAYIFTLPFAEVLEHWLIGLGLYGFVAVLLTYLLSGDSLSSARFQGFSVPQQRHLAGVGAGALLVLAYSFWLSRYELLYSLRGVSVGASYTDVAVQLPLYTLLSGFTLLFALYLLGRLCFQPARIAKTPPGTSGWDAKWGAPLGLKLLVLLVVLNWVGPEVVQTLVVEPNELAQERPFIERTIALTRHAFRLDAIETQDFDPSGKLTAADLATNDLTLRNIRLWDRRPMLATNRQLQQIRPYYRFPDADVDRYTLPRELNSGANLEQRQVFIAARELDDQAIPQAAQTWVNRHLIYTHGYGFTLSPVNTVGTGGLPEYFVKDITGGATGALTTASPAIRASVPIGQPRIYYGEITNTYVMTQTRTQELDYPSGSENAYNVYDGAGGISMGSLWRRGLFALYLRDWQILFTRDFLPETRILFRRNLKERIEAIVPFLRYDKDPYLVAAKTPTPQAPTPQAGGDPSHLYWIIDAYTTSNRYPYSDAGQNGINYIRNAVKVVVDAYHGSVTFYIADPQDPLIATWSKIFPTLFKPLAEMPAPLKQHLRYPVDLFKIQSERLMTYQMSDPQVFYNREDQWQIPNEVYGDEARPVEPYYLFTRLPAVPQEEFILLLPYTPQERTNLIAWLAARSDGENYGKLLLYRFPKERLVYGTEQIEARINQDPIISQQISLWNRQGSRAIQGNLLVIPIKQSLLYVEPLYLEATQNSLPTLVRVIVAYENRIVMAPTLEESLKALFTP